MTTASAPRLVAIGVAAGLLAGLFGVGGGILVVPALVAMCTHALASSKS